ncbi:MAG: beta strand repeat-containing protein, partial [Flavobacteriales bacterium]
GAIDATISGGSSPFTIAWSGPDGYSSSDEDISGLSAGVYVLNVSDANGCSAGQAFSVDQPGMFSISATLSDHGGFGVSCADGSDGSISITASGGTGPYTHAWTGPSGFTASTQSISAAAPGTYTYTITDSNGCSAAESFTLTAPAPLVLSLASSTVLGGWHIGCHGAASGSIDASISGGIAPYGISWSGPGGFASGSEDISGLAAGAYTLTVADGNGCSASSGITLTQAPALAGATAIIANASCNGASDGTASASVSGGTAPYGFAWATIPAQSGPVASSLGAGSYTCVITDANGCTASVNATIGEPTPLTVAIISTTDVLCHDGTSGSAQASASGGTGPYSYSWNSTPAQTSATATALPQGTYTVTATDANGCTATAEATIGGPQFEVWAAPEAVTPVSCFGLSDGAVTLDVSGGSGSYTITWNTSPPQTGLTATGLAAGNYLALVVDDNGCDQEKWVSVTIPGPATPLVVQLQVSPITCFGANNGAVNLTMSGGQGPYTHIWSAVGGGTSGAEDLSGLDPDTYMLHAFDAFGCAFDTSFTLTQPPALTSSAYMTPAACQGTPSGAIDLSVSGGTAPYTYAWSGPNGFAANTQDIAGIVAGTYISSIVDAQGCQNVISHVVTQPATISLAVSAATHSGGWNTSCNGATDGSIELSVLGGTPSYTFSWTGPDGFTSGAEDPSGLAAGTYSVLVTDQNGCTGAAQVTLTQPNALSAAITPSSFSGYGVSCAGSADGALDISVSGGTAAYAIAWSGPDGFSATGASLSGLAAGTYTASITDANGCQATAAMDIVQPPALSLSIQAFVWPGGTNISCAAANDGALELSITGGLAPYAINWTNGLGFSSTAASISALEAGGYQATVTDANGCTATALAQLIAPEPIGLSASISAMNGSNVSCTGATDGSIDLAVSGGTAPYVFAWSNGTSTEDLSGISAGSYTVTVTDANACSFTSTYTLAAPQPLDIAITASTYPGGMNTSCHGAADGALHAAVAGGTEPYAFAWTGPGGFASNDTAIAGLAAGTYQLIITDANGCAASMSAAIAEPMPVMVQISSTTYTGGYNVPCAGLSSANALASASGGTPGYGFAWSGPDGFTSADAAIVGLAAGSYSATVTDANGCTGSASIILQEPDSLVTAISIVDLGGFAVSCNGNDGSASVSVSGGTAPYAIGWTGPNGFASTQASASGLAEGDYQLTVTDANGCISQQSITLDAPEPIAASFSYTANACPGDLAGAIDLTVTGGAAPYTFVWSGPGGFTSGDEDISGLATGDYAVQVGDALGCNGSFAAQLSGPAPIVSGSYVSFYGLYNLQCLGDSSGTIVLAPS